MESDFLKNIEAKLLFEEQQARKRAEWLAWCFVYEAFQKIGGKTSLHFIGVFNAFVLLGRVKAVLGERYEEIKSKLYEKAKVKLLANGYTEDNLKLAVKVGIEIGEDSPIPTKIGVGSTHYDFFANIVIEKIGHEVRYVPGKGWKVWNGRSWKKRPKEWGIGLFIHEVIRQKIAIWREALKAGASHADLEEWLKELEKNIHDAWWLEKVEEQLRNRF